MAVRPYATAPELVVLDHLARRRYILGEDFVFQSKQFGGRLDKGGQVVDFFFSRPPGLAISVLGEYFHYELRGGNRAVDLMARNELVLIGDTLIFIDEGDLLGPRSGWFVDEALQFRDHSRMGRGG